jgi:hypothetical protein
MLLAVSFLNLLNYDGSTWPEEKERKFLSREYEKIVVIEKAR